jgi:hypothetical protein
VDKPANVNDLLEGHVALLDVRRRHKHSTRPRASGPTL